jgi:hypothetical protein
VGLKEKLDLRLAVILKQQEMKVVSPAQEIREEQEALVALVHLVHLVHLVQVVQPVVLAKLA